MMVDEYLATFLRLAQYFPKFLRGTQAENPDARSMREKITIGLSLPDWSLAPEGALLLGGKLYLPEECREEVLKEFHCSRFAIHPGGNKMYKDLQREYRWPEM